MSNKPSAPRWTTRAFNVGTYKVRVFWGRILMGSAALALAGLAGAEVAEMTAPAGCCELARAPRIERVLELPEIEPAEATPRPRRCKVTFESGVNIDLLIDDIKRMVAQIENDTAETESIGVLIPEDHISEFQAELEAILEHQQRLRAETRRLIEDEE